MCTKRVADRVWGECCGGAIDKLTKTATIWGRLPMLGGQWVSWPSAPWLSSRRWNSRLSGVYFPSFSSVIMTSSRGNIGSIQRRNRKHLPPTQTCGSSLQQRKLLAQPNKQLACACTSTTVVVVGGEGGKVFYLHA